ncbi:Bacilysin biosynthesis oxidoreductase bacC [Colletotrichum higginsianum IMI 349063]|uniref:Bacilysin biosynthesis oxidoreductase bacC n=1 Tax=Colletotrichum higginsianum (strain IMI 349063) TaxID=759273 RepID=A0A1B7YMT1_COLHI|nr:Bacilysin biosynthesis oxidoreductase bacC [Colletotrichum higginsianum IMI 349063]OBR13375.1 Bacilysin biosynthesis oxidoreductase bacC [Colletotrichum higginsianum IMI 349063]
MSIDYTSKTVLITGGASGLGLSLTTHFLAANATVLALDISADALAELPSKVPDAHHTRLHPVHADVSSPESVAAAILSWVDGGAGDDAGQKRRLDVLVNNAGISDKMEPVADCDLDVWNRQILINTTGPFITSQVAIRQFLKQEPVNGQRGVILNVISAGGLHGGRAGVAYTVSKHGTVGLTKSTAAFYGPRGIRCLAILPGPMMTNMVNEGHAARYHPEGLAMVLGDPARKGWNFGWSPLDQVSKTVLCLCADGIHTINGALVPTDMGWTSI